MKKLIVILFLLIPFTTKDKKFTELPSEFYAVYRDGTVKTTSIFFALTKEERNKLINELYK